MNDNLTRYDYSELYMQQMREQAERERLVNQLPRKRGLLETALTLLTTGKSTD